MEFMEIDSISPETGRPMFTSVLFINFFLIPYGLFLDLRHSPIKIFKLKFIFGIWSCSVGQKNFVSIGLNDFVVLFDQGGYFRL